jgi:hypothetical protein
MGRLKIDYIILLEAPTEAKAIAFLLCLNKIISYFGIMPCFYTEP